MTYETLKTAAQANKYFDAQLLAHGTFRLTDMVRVTSDQDGFKPHVQFSFEVSSSGQVSRVAMTDEVLKHLIDTFNDSGRTAERFAGSGPEEVAKRGMDRLLPFFMEARDTLEKLVKKTPSAAPAAPAVAYQIPKREGVVNLIRT